MRYLHGESLKFNDLPEDNGLLPSRSCQQEADMTDKISGENIEDSDVFRAARERAGGYAEDPARLDRLVDRATRKARARQGKLSEVRDSLMAMLRLLRAWASGRYRDVPWNSLLSIIAAVIYFVMPTDLVPDFVLGWGFVDDAALLAWILGSVRVDLDDFIAWEVERAEPPDGVLRRE